MAELMCKEGDENENALDSGRNEISGANAWDIGEKETEKKPEVEANADSEPCAERDGEIEKREGVAEVIGSGPAAFVIASVLPTHDPTLKSEAPRTFDHPSAHFPSQPSRSILARLRWILRPRFYFHG